MSQPIDISFIIPAYNEEKNLEQVLESIFMYASHLSIEVIIIDNGSTDNTANIIKNSQAIYLSFPVGNISAVRNAGVQISQGQCLVFLDADVVLTKYWQDSVESLIKELKNNFLLITGSRCLPENDSTWLNKYWFCPLNKYHANYINSGHLIISRKLCDVLKGFDELLQTAEDYDFCMRAIKIGAEIKEDKLLRVIHLGYPKTLFDFAQRERWHGRQDVNSLQEFSQSKIAWLALFLLLQTLACCILSVLTQSTIPVILSLTCTYGLALILTIYKFKMFTLNIIPVAFIFTIYLLGRSLAVVDKCLQLLRQFFVFSEKK